MQALRSMGGRISAGVIDSAVSSASGFALALAATRLLGDTQLGIYAVFFAAYTLAMGLPNELTFTPAEIAAIQVSEEKRVAVLRRSLVVGFPIAAGGALLTLISIPITASHAGPGEIVALAVPTFVAAVFGSVEEHIRKVLHLGGRSRSAVVASIVMLAAAVVGVVAMWLAGVPVIWIPMTALAFANISSIIAGLLVARTHLDHDVSALDLGLRKLSGTGRWLLIIGFVPAGNAFIASALVTSLAGAAAMGYAEAARTVAQPVLVLGIGLLRVLGPRSMEAALAGRPGDARHVARVFRSVIAIGSLVFLIGTAVDWPLNVFALLVPKAYVVPGLVAVMVVANLVIGLALPERSELLGAGMARLVATREYVAVVLSTVAAALAGSLGSYAWPVSRLAPAVFRSGIYHHDAKQMYRRFERWGLLSGDAPSPGDRDSTTDAQFGVISTPTESDERHSRSSSE